MDETTKTDSQQDAELVAKLKQIKREQEVKRPFTPEERELQASLDAELAQRRA